MVAKHKISEEFTKVIPEKVLKAAIAEFERVDKPPAYADVQREIGKKLLKLRVSFQENSAAAADISYFVDFKMTEGSKGTVILL